MWPNWKRHGKRCSRRHGRSYITPCCWRLSFVSLRSALCTWYVSPGRHDVYFVKWMARLNVWWWWTGQTGLTSRSSWQGLRGLTAVACRESALRFSGFSFHLGTTSTLQYLNYRVRSTTIRYSFVLHLSDFCGRDVNFSSQRGIKALERDFQKLDWDSIVL